MIGSFNIGSLNNERWLSSWSGPDSKRLSQNKCWGCSFFLPVPDFPLLVHSFSLCRIVSVHYRIFCVRFYCRWMIWVRWLLCNIAMELHSLQTWWRYFTLFFSCYMLRLCNSIESQSSPRILHLRNSQFRPIFCPPLRSYGPSNNPLSGTRISNILKLDRSSGLDAIPRGLSNLLPGGCRACQPPSSQTF